VSDTPPNARALRPLWMLATGAALGSLSTFSTVAAPAWATIGLLAIGAAAVVAAVGKYVRENALVWLMAGLALTAGRGLACAADRLRLQTLFGDGEMAVRARIVVSEGWTESRWGHRTQVRVVAAWQDQAIVRLPRRCTLEVQGSSDTSRLPSPGTVIDTLARVRGSPWRPLLVVASNRLLLETGKRQFLPALRDRLARDLVIAAGTDAQRIRSAELAGALALGRRDLVPTDRRDGWRRSGLAHLLAVSGLHVGLVGGAVWLSLALLGVRPQTARVTTLLALPAYAVLAGAAPSALRAALMGVIYLGARLLGRAILPMAAVLLTAITLLAVHPQLIADTGFQLTIVVTSALVRWVPTIAAILPGPRIVTGAIAVPVVAQVVSAPLIAAHFRTLIPGAILANLAALPLLGPTVLVSVATTLVAVVWADAAGLGLDLVHGLSRALFLVSSPARSAELVTPAVPIAAAVALVVFGWVALQPSRWARGGAAMWCLIVAGLFSAWRFPEPPATPSIELLPVTDGAAVFVRDGADAVLADCGRYAREAAELLADSGGRRLRAVLASHTDEDHVGGMLLVLRSFAVERLLLPRWMMSDPLTVPLLRAARRRGTRVEPVARGLVVGLGAIRLEVVWPPGADPPREENERSLVARLVLDHGAVLVTSDIGRLAERRIAHGNRLRCSVLIVPHHGGRGSSSDEFLESAGPAVALIPAASGNTHGHPHREVLVRLAEHRIPARYPVVHGRCGATWNGREWQLFP
jgi:DNA internalization-related competence protein ComEC/Rec2